MNMAGPSYPPNSNRIYNTFNSMPTDNFTGIPNNLNNFMGNISNNAPYWNPINTMNPNTIYSVMDEPYYNRSIHPTNYNNLYPNKMVMNNQIPPLAVNQYVNQIFYNTGYNNFNSSQMMPISQKQFPGNFPNYGMQNTK